MSHTDGRTGTTIDRDAIDITTCLAEIDAFIRRSWPSTIRLELHAAGALPAIRCDRPGLLTAILNLAFNARDAMPNGGVITIIVVGISRADVATQVEVRVSDNGIGMTRETLARAFDPFFTTKAEGLGGFGLPIVQRFAQEAGGQVEIQSKPGVGTTATLRLPVSAGETELQPQRRAQLSPEINVMPLPTSSAGALPH
jgi:signal transduction histidine kinase